MKIGFIGAGKVATAFGLYLKDKNQTISGYYSRSEISARRSSELVNTLAFTDIGMCLAQSDLIFITTGDDQIETVVASICEFEQSVRNLEPNQTQTQKIRRICHMSGAKSSEVLYPLKAFGHQCFSLHPLQTIADPIKGKELLSTCYYAFEGDEDSVMEEWIKILDGPVVRMDRAQKPYYHAAACIASNYLYTLVDGAVAAMTLAGFSKEKGYEALLPLIYGTLENCRHSEPKDALTGPIARGDVETVKKHMQALESNKDLKSLYQLMGLATLQLASSAKLKDESVKTLLEQAFTQEERAYENGKNNSQSLFKG